MSKFKDPRKNKRSKRSIDGLLWGPMGARGSRNSPDDSSRVSKRVDGDTGFSHRSSRSEHGGIGDPKKSKHSKGGSDQEDFGIEPESSAAVGVGDKFEYSVTVSTAAAKDSLTKRRKDKGGEEDKSHHSRSIRKAVLISLLVVIVFFGSVGVYAFLKTRGIFRGSGGGAAALEEGVDPSKLNGEGDGRVNILMLGKGGEGHEAPDLTDTIILASIDPVKKEAAMVSVPRDLFVQNAEGYRMKINSVYATAKEASIEQGNSEKSAEDSGVQAIEESVREVLGVPIHYYTMVDFTAFEEAIDTVGGIDIDVQERLVDYSVAWELGGDPVIAEAGWQHFDGRMALFYARSRKGSDRGDFDRTARQQEVMVALQQKILSLGTFSNPIKAVELLNTLGNHVSTNLSSVSEMRRLYDLASEINPDSIQNIGLADPPNILVDTGMVGDQSVVLPVAGMDNYEEIQSFVRNKMRDSFIAEENARIIILNGTSVPGLAAATEKELKSYGYNVVAVANAPTEDYVSNALIDNSKGKNPYTENYLEKRLNLISSSPSIEGLADETEAEFVIILGTDEVN